MIYTINGTTLLSMLQASNENLQKNVDRINALNVFPVPDGDTGTNMNLTFTAGVNEAKKIQTDKVFNITQALSKGLLMGARGNSGVILSQLFRGFAAYTKDKEELNTFEFAEALQSGVDLAYKAVIKPVEGTILTVAKDTAQHALSIASYEKDFISFTEKLLQASKESLKRTPNLLAVLKEVGVVDSGGQGLVCVYEGFLASLKGDTIEQAFDYDHADNKEQHVQDEIAELMKSGVLSEKDIVYGYCTEFIIRSKTPNFDENQFRENISQFGDSLLVISDEELVKVHIHAEKLSDVFLLSQHVGELIDIKIENMREQFRNRASVQKETPKKKIAFVASLTGKGLSKIYYELGADEIIEGGQTMNPSTEDLIKAIKQAHAEHVFILPNNSNIILTAKQAAELVDVKVTVIPTKNTIQGIQALISSNKDQSPEQIKKSMLKSIETVECGQFTKAIRDTTIDGIEVREGEFIGILNDKISVCCDNLEEALLTLLGNVINEDHELVTFYYGEEMTQEFANLLATSVEETFENVDVQVLNGGQPLYPLFVSVE